MDSSMYTRKLETGTEYEYSKQRDYALKTASLKSAVVLQADGSSKYVSDKHEATATYADIQAGISRVSAIVNISPITVLANSVTVQWGGAFDLTSYTYSIPVYSDDGILNKTATFNNLLSNRPFTFFIVGYRSGVNPGSVYSDTVTFITAPDPPINLQNPSIGQQFMNLTWNPPACGATSYSYYISGNDGLILSGNLSDTFVNLTNLNIGATYSIQIFALNINGYPSLPLTGSYTTLPGSVYASATSLTSSSYIATWNNLFFTSTYNITYPIYTSPSSITSSTINVYLSTYFFINNLNSASLYNFEVKAINPLWATTPSSMITTLLPPAGPSSISTLATGISSFTVSWPQEGLLTNTIPITTCTLYDNNFNIIETKPPIVSTFTNIYTPTPSLLSYTLGNATFYLDVVTSNASGSITNQFSQSVLGTITFGNQSIFSNNITLTVSSRGPVNKLQYALFSHGPFTNISNTNYQSNAGTLISTNFALNTIMPNTPTSAVSFAPISYSNLTASTIYKLSVNSYTTPTLSNLTDVYFMTSIPNAFSNIVISSITNTSYGISWTYSPIFPTGLSPLYTYRDSIVNTTLVSSSYAAVNYSGVANSNLDIIIGANINLYMNSVGITPGFQLQTLGGSINANVLMSPDPPENLRITSATINTVTIAWSRPFVNNVNPIDYSVSIPSISFISSYIGLSNTSVTISGLTQNTSYSAIVTAINTLVNPDPTNGMYGGGSNSSTLTFTTSPNTPSITAYIINTALTTITITDSNYSANLTYGCTLIDQNGILIPTTITTANPPVITIQGGQTLVPTSYYILSVTVSNQTASATQSGIIIYTPPPIPVLTTSATSNSIITSWPTSSGSGGRSVSYNISINPNISTYTGVTSPYTIYSLSPSTDYTVSVSASIGIGNPVTGSGNIYTLPQGPSSITYTSISPSTFTVTWPSEGTASYKTILLNSTSNILNTSTISNITNLNTITYSDITGLNINNNYTLYISTLNANLSTITSIPFNITTQPSLLTNYQATIYYNPSNSLVNISLINSYGYVNYYTYGLYSYGSANSINSESYKSGNGILIGSLTTISYPSLSLMTNVNIQYTNIIDSNTVYRNQITLYNSNVNAQINGYGSNIINSYLLSPTSSNAFTGVTVSTISTNAYVLNWEWAGPRANFTTSSYSGGNGLYYDGIRSSFNSISNLSSFSTVISASYIDLPNSVINTTIIPNTSNYQSTIGINSPFYATNNNTTYSLYVLTNPPSPSNITFTRTTGSITVTWPANPSFTYAYNMIDETPGSSFTYSGSLGVGVSTITIYSIGDSKLYSFTLTAGNVTNVSPPGTINAPCGGGYNYSAPVSIIPSPTVPTNLFYTIKDANILFGCWPIPLYADSYSIVLSNRSDGQIRINSTNLTSNTVDLSSMGYGSAVPCIAFSDSYLNYIDNSRFLHWGAPANIFNMQITASNTISAVSSTATVVPQPFNQTFMTISGSGNSRSITWSSSPQYQFIWVLYSVSGSTYSGVSQNDTWPNFQYTQIANFNNFPSGSYRFVLTCISINSIYNAPADRTLSSIQIFPTQTSRSFTAHNVLNFTI